MRSTCGWPSSASSGRRSRPGGRTRRRITRTSTRTNTYAPTRPPREADGALTNALSLPPPQDYEYLEAPTDPGAAAGDYSYEYEYEYEYDYNYDSAGIDYSYEVRNTSRG